MDEFMLMINILSRLGFNLSVEAMTIKQGDPTSREVCLSAYMPNGVEEFRFYFNGNRACVGARGQTIHTKEAHRG
jgi:hypothetical protein